MTAKVGADTWQKTCTEALEQAVASGRNGRQNWEAFRARIPETLRIIIADADFSGKSLAGFDLSRCYITRTNFKASNLSGANLSQSIFRNCDATGANIEGANFRDADAKGDGLILLDCRDNPDTVFDISPQALPSLLPQGLLDAALRAHHERRWRNRKSYSPPFRFVLWLTRYGFSFSRLVAVGGVVVAGFAVCFFIAAGPNSTLAGAFLQSFAYFLNLDAAHSAGWLLFIGQVEALIGLLFFALLTAILVSNFLEKS